MIKEKTQPDDDDVDEMDRINSEEWDEFLAEQGPSEEERQQSIFEDRLATYRAEV